MRGEKDENVAVDRSFKRIIVPKKHRCLICMKQKISEFCSSSGNLEPIEARLANAMKFHSPYVQQVQRANLESEAKVKFLEGSHPRTHKGGEGLCRAALLYVLVCVFSKAHKRPCFNKDTCRHISRALP
jgi:hypothetical protein